MTYLRNILDIPGSHQHPRRTTTNHCKTTPLSAILTLRSPPIYLRDKGDIVRGHQSAPVSIQGRIQEFKWSPNYIRSD